MSTPQRIQRKRTPDWRMPSNSVYVGRPSKWGNIIRIPNNPRESVAWFRLWLRNMITPEQYTNLWLNGALAIRSPGNVSLQEYYESRRRRLLADLHELRGKNLVDWCPLDQPCHADVLLRINSIPDDQFSR